MFPDRHNSREKFPPPVPRPRPSKSSRLRPPSLLLAAPAESFPPADPHRHSREAQIASVSPHETSSIRALRPGRDLPLPSRRPEPRPLQPWLVPAQSGSRSPLCKSHMLARQTTQPVARSQQQPRPSRNGPGFRGLLRPHPVQRFAPAKSAPLAPFARADTPATLPLSSLPESLEDARRTA